MLSGTASMIYNAFKYLTIFNISLKEDQNLRTFWDTFFSALPTKKTTPQSISHYFPLPTETTSLSCWKPRFPGHELHVRCGHFLRQITKWQGMDVMPGFIKEYCFWDIFLWKIWLVYIKVILVLGLIYSFHTYSLESRELLMGGWWPGCLQRILHQLRNTLCWDATYH